MGRFFLDLGTHYLNFNHPGNTGMAPSGLESFISSGILADQDWEVLTIEASPRIFEANLSSLGSFSERFRTFEARNQAVTGADGMVEFLDLHSNPAGSNAVGHRFRSTHSASPELKNLDRAVTVESIAFSTLVREIVNEDPERTIHIKMDIEGSEFLAIKDMLAHPDCMSNIKEFWIEWHLRFFKHRPLHFVKNLILKLRFQRQCSKMRIAVMSHW